MSYPSWLKVKAVSLEQQAYVENLLRKADLHTVCESACCPNLGECFSRKTATFLILGDICTRNCRFCAVMKGIPLALARSEPERLAQAVEALGLRYVVITSVTRDDLPDGGASVFAESVRSIRDCDPLIFVEVLIPDFLGSKKALKTITDSLPSVINHNIETVPRLYSKIRLKADYARSLELLRGVKAIDSNIKTKSGIMLGLGETDEEVLETIRDIRETGCDLLTIGQYLAPSAGHAPVKRYVEPVHFKWFGEKALELGFSHVASAPLVRSSYHAGETYLKTSTKSVE
jgi:lipoyl synthase